MSETPRFALPLVAPAQAQKHVTVNEALTRLDAMTQLVIRSVGDTAPPSAAAEGDVHFVPAGSVNAWEGQEGRLAVFQNGGWTFVDPQAGWRAFLADAGHLAIWTGAGWAPVGLPASPSGAGMSIRAVEIDHTVGSGATSLTAPLIPAGCVVFAVTGIVTGAITGGATSFRLGVPGAPDRYGSGIGVAASAWLRGITGSPLAYHDPTELLLTAEGGSFAGGAVRLAAHIAEFSLPSLT